MQCPGPRTGRVSFWIGYCRVSRRCESGHLGNRSPGVIENTVPAIQTEYDRRLPLLLAVLHLIWNRSSVVMPSQPPRAGRAGIQSSTLMYFLKPSGYICRVVGNLITVSCYLRGIPSPLSILYSCVSQSFIQRIIRIVNDTTQSVHLHLIKIQGYRSPQRISR